jgi:lysophospholipase L1-like esterase
MNLFLIGLVGDSDIAQWPISLLPNISPRTGTDTGTTSSNVLVSGHSGMTLNQLLPRVKEAIATLLQHDSSCTAPTPTNKFLVVCGGENDIGCGIPLSTSKLAFQSLLDLFHYTNTVNELSKHQHNFSLQSPIVHLIFLGPKFEPWLRHDNSARKSYVQMSITFEQLCRQQRKNDVENKSVTCCGSDVEYVHYIDCLTMFCGNSGGNNQIGAIYGGKAIPDTMYFHSDELHLSDLGYRIWKSKIEDKIATIRSTTRLE